MCGRMLCLILVASLVPLAGCAMCDCPYDYAGPTYTPESGEPPFGDYRAGSVLSGGGFVPAPGSYDVDGANGGEPTPAEADDTTFSPSLDSTFDSAFPPDTSPAPAPQTTTPRDDALDAPAPDAPSSDLPPL